MNPNRDAREQRREVLLAVVLILLISALAYLPLAAKLGFYHDDWFTTASRVGQVSLTVMHSVDRPGMGVLYQVVSDMLGEAPIAWHLFAWAVRAAGGLALVWLARLLWPEQKLATTLMGVLYVVYPGFLQQPSANNYQNHLVAYLAAILSLALTINAIRSKRWVTKIILTLLALVLAFGYPRVYEGMIGMEGLRFILIWYVLKIKESKKFWIHSRDTVIWFTPFLLNAMYFIYWRLYQFVSLRSTVDASVLLENLKSNFIGTSIQVFAELLKDVYNSVIAAWFTPLYQLGMDARYRFVLLGIVLGVIAIILILLYTQRGTNSNARESEQHPTWSRDSVILGGIGILLTLVPIALSGRGVQFQNFNDRYTIQSIVPITFLIIGGIWIIAKAEWRKYLVGGFAGLAICTHILNATNYASNWELQRQVWWQLSWRAPQLNPGTNLILQAPTGYKYPEGFEIWAPANRIYYSNAKGPIITAEILNNDTLADLKNQVTVERNFRLIEFNLDYSQTLVLSMPTVQSCLHALDRTRLELSQWDDALTRSAAVVSQIDQIDLHSDSHRPPAIIFGREPEHEWCYYYQKADLARQRGDWQEVVRLGEEAARSGFVAADPVEWAPFLEANLRLDRLDEARKLADQVRAAPGVAEGLCAYYSVDSTSVGFNAYQLLCSTQ